MAKNNCKIKEPVFCIIPMATENDDHRNAVRCVWENNFNTCHASNERYHWLYNENPHGAAKTWLVVDNDDQIVGCSTIYPKKMWVRNKSIMTWTAADLAVNKEHRCLGPAIGLQRAIVGTQLPDNDQFIVGRPNEAACGIFKRIKYQTIGAETCWSKPLQLREKISKYVRYRYLISALAFLYDVFLYLQFCKVTFLYRQRFNVKIITHCDERFDKLWHEAGSAYGITTEKKSDYLNWRFANHKDRNIKFYCLLDTKSDLIGYIAFSINEKHVTIEDLFVKDLCKDLPLILISFSKEMKKAGHLSILISYLGDKSFHSKLKKLFFFKRGNGNISFAYFHPKCTSDYQTYILKENNWFQIGDFDI